jgi:predicted DNA-binding transcriptional regulator AlpA
MNVTTLIDGEEVIGVKTVLEITGLNNTKLYELLRYDRFPKPLKVGNKSFWKRAEIEAYIESTRKSVQ